MNYEFKSEMASDMNGLIEIKVATHHCESTYLDRAKSFDSFCAEHYPDADLVTKSIVLEWIKAHPWIERTLKISGAVFTFQVTNANMVDFAAAIAMYHQQDKKLQEMEDYFNEH